VCFVGRLNPVKNIGYVCRLVEEIAERVGMVVFDVFGPDEGSKAEFDDWVSQLNTKNLTAAYRGVLPQSAVSLTLSKYHFSISCSLTEGFGMSVAESLQVGVPPIVGRVGGPAAYCDQSNSIVLLNYSDSELSRCAENVGKIFQNDDAYYRMQACAVETFRVEQTYVGKLEQALASLI
jgi:glycosyltransferase involved in cell wall biosynthesis